MLTKKFYIALTILSLLIVSGVYFFISKTEDLEPYPRKRLVLITGCARSGTTYISQVLRKCGFDVRHEKDGKVGVASWVMAVDSDKTPWGPGANDYVFEHVFHQVRDPLKTIASASNEPPQSWQYISQFVPELKPEDSRMVRAAKYWYYWNLLAEQKAEWTYRIEDFDHHIDEMSSRLGINLPQNANRRVEKYANTRGYKEKFTWQDLKMGLDPELYSNIVALAKKYGYPVEE